MSFNETSLELTSPYQTSPDQASPDQASPTDPLRLDCAECTMQHTDACDDCVVTFLCAREPDDAVVVDVAELAALRSLGRAGLVPGLRHPSAHAATS